MRNLEGLSIKKLLQEWDNSKNDKIKSILLYKLDVINSAWLKYCYYYASFSTFLKAYNVSQYSYNKMLKIEGGLK